MWCGNFDNFKEYLRIFLVVNYLVVSYFNLVYMKKKNNISCNLYDNEEYCYFI